MKELSEIHRNLEYSLQLLKKAGEAYRDGNFEEVYVHMASLAPQLQRAVGELRLHVENRQKSELLDTDVMDAALDVNMTWNVTRTPPNSPLIADDICIIRRSACNPDSKVLQDIESTRGSQDATEVGVEGMWEKMICEPRVLLAWGGITGYNAVFKTHEEIPTYISVDARRLATIRSLTSFDRAEFSMEKTPALVLIRSDSPTPVASLLTKV